VNVLDLFSGIGGFSLGLERAGMRTVAFCEIDPFCRRVLAKHWPTVTCYGNVRTLTAARLRADGIVADVICGGFPCQDISSAGKGVGIEGERSGLWKEYARIIGELRPHYVIVENVAALLSRGLDVVLRDLASIRYDAEWNCIPASAAGAPHRRDRLWLVAYPDGSERGQISSTRQRLAWADCCHNGKKVQVDLAQAVKRWPTPHGFSQDGRSNGPSGNELGRAVNRMMVPTPKLPSGGGQVVRTTPGGGIRKLEDWVSADQGQNTGSLNPTWVEWLMGFPAGWTALKGSETPSSRKSRKSSGGRS